MSLQDWTLKYSIVWVWKYISAWTNSCLVIEVIVNYSRWIWKKESSVDSKLSSLTAEKNYHNENMVPGDLHWNQALHVPITYRENNLNLQDQEPLEVTGKLLFSQDSI